LDTDKIWKQDQGQQVLNASAIEGGIIREKGLFFYARSFARNTFVFSVLTIAATLH